MGLRAAAGLVPPAFLITELGGGAVSWHHPIMPIFARRRLRSMLDELSSHVAAAKANDLVSQLENCNTRQALAAEAELSMLLAISRVAHLTIEPDLPGSNRHPDALTDNLLGSGSAIVEVRAMSDYSFSGKEAMDRTANIITDYANCLRKGAGRHLKFEFLERSYWNKGFHRERCVDSGFKLSASIKQQLKAWYCQVNRFEDLLSALDTP